MRIRPLIALIGLRQRLFWAKVRSQPRSRNVALTSGLLLFGFFVLTLAAGGAGAGAIATRFAKPVLVADFVLGLVFVSALIASWVFGLDSSPVLSEESLRRYPLLRIERLIARYAAGLFDPLWLIVFVLDVSIAVGFAVAGASPWWVAVPASMLFFATNYLAARLLVEIVARIMRTRSGPFLLLLAMVALVSLPAVLVPLLRNHDPFLASGTATVWRLTPIPAAAKMLAGGWSAALPGATLVIFVWLLALGAAILWLEHVPMPTSAIRGAEAKWGSLYDRVAWLFGPEMAPLVGKILRYYIRTPQFRLNYPLIMIGVPLFSLTVPDRRLGAMAGFLWFLAFVSVIGLAGVSFISGNAFGQDGSGFRRYFLLPVSPAVVLAAVALVPLLLGGIALVVSVCVWLAVWHGPLDAQMVVMLLSTGLCTMLLFQALAIWTSLFSPRKSDFKIQFGNRQPAAQNVIFSFGVVAFIFVLLGVFQHVGFTTVIAGWWVTPILVIPAAAFYLFTLRKCGRLFRLRREWILSVLERNA